MCTLHGVHAQLLQMCVVQRGKESGKGMAGAGSPFGSPSKAAAWTTTEGAGGSKLAGGHAGMLFWGSPPLHGGVLPAPQLAVQPHIRRLCHVPLILRLQHKKGDGTCSLAGLPMPMRLCRVAKAA